MAFPKGTIKLLAAQEIFTDCNIIELKIGDEVAGYKATHNGQELQNKSLTKLCKILWIKANELPQNDQRIEGKTVVLSPIGQGHTHDLATPRRETNFSLF